MKHELQKTKIYKAVDVNAEETARTPVERDWEEIYEVMNFDWSKTKGVWTLTEPPKDLCTVSNASLQLHGQQALQRCDFSQSSHICPTEARLCGHQAGRYRVNGYAWNPNPLLPFTFCALGLSSRTLRHPTYKKLRFRWYSIGLRCHSCTLKLIQTNNTYPSISNVVENICEHFSPARRKAPFNSHLSNNNNKNGSNKNNNSICNIVRLHRHIGHCRPHPSHLPPGTETQQHKGSATRRARQPHIIQRRGWQEVQSDCAAKAGRHRRRGW